jgi:type VI protein secretion system component Hcp
MLTRIRDHPRIAAVVAVTAAVWLSSVFTSQPAGSATAPRDVAAAPASAPAALPASQVIGEVTYQDIDGTTDVTADIRSFALQVNAQPGTGQANFSDATVAQGTIGQSPLIMEAIAEGRHLPSITVVIYRQSTSTRFQEFVFREAQFSLDSLTRNAPASSPGIETLAWTYRQIEQRTYRNDGTTLLHSTCYDVFQHRSC